MQKKRLFCGRTAKVCPSVLPGDHLLLLVGGVPTAAQNFGRRGQEVEAVVLKVLVYQRQQDLRREGPSTTSTDTAVHSNAQTSPPLHQHSSSWEPQSSEQWCICAKNIPKICVWVDTYYSASSGM